MIILGIHGGVTIQQHDPGAALIIDGKLKIFVEEERLNRIKTSTGILPIRSIKACLDEAKIKIQDVDLVSITGETYNDIIPRTSEWLMHHFGHSPEIETVNHQTAHIASSFYQSDFDEAMCLSYDAYGDKLSGALARASKKKGIEIIETIPDDNSLGVFYATITSFLGFKPGEDEFKVMGLAAYGSPNVNLEKFCKPSLNGYECNHIYFRERKNATQYEPFYSKNLINLIGNPRRINEPITKNHMDIASSAQKTIEDCSISLIKKLYKITKSRNLCLSGGVALNCSANGKISKLDFIDKLFIQPSSSDRGLPLGCALYSTSIRNIEIKKIKNVFYGPTSSEKLIEESIKLSGVKYKRIDNPGLIAAELISQNKIIGWFQGRSEYGPRSLGNRSILANPLNKNMKDKINKKIKFREEFRPFAPSVLEEQCHKYFKMKNPSPFMTVAYDVNESTKNLLPSIVHINNTARVQTVNKIENRRYHELLENFKNITGDSVVLNTSFNIMGQPIVEKPLEAISTFNGCGMDHLIVGNYLISK